MKMTSKKTFFRKCILRFCVLAHTHTYKEGHVFNIVGGSKDIKKFQINWKVLCQCNWERSLPQNLIPLREHRCGNLMRKFDTLKCINFHFCICVCVEWCGMVWTVWMLSPEIIQSSVPTSESNLWTTTTSNLNCYPAADFPLMFQSVKLVLWLVK